MVYGQVGVEYDALHTGFPFLGGNQDYAVGGLRAVEGCCGSAFQNTHAFNVVRIQVGDAVAGVAVAGIVVAAHGGECLFGHVVQHRYAVDDV